MAVASSAHCVGAILRLVEHNRHHLGGEMGLIIIVVLILLLAGAFPSWNYSQGWGYGPSGIIGVILIVLIVLLIMGRL